MDTRGPAGLAATGRRYSPIPLTVFARWGLPCNTRRMTAKVWKRSSGRVDKNLTDDRKSLIERYMIDAEEAKARTQRAAEEQARPAAKEARRAAAEEEAARRAAAEAAAKRAAEE